MLLLLALASVFLLPSPWGFVALGGAAFVEVAELALWRRLLRRYRIRKGTEAEIGAEVEVTEACAPEGRVRYRGEIWRARASAPLAVGERARIAAFDGLTLVVEPR